MARWTLLFFGLALASGARAQHAAQLPRPEQPSGQPSGQPSRQPSEQADEVLFLELATGGGAYQRQDVYGERLYDFGFRRVSSGLELDLEITLGYRLHPHIAVGARYFDLDASEYARDVEIAQAFAYDSFAFDAFVQGDYAFGKERLLTLFLRGGIGIAAVSTEFDAIDVLPEEANGGPLSEATSLIEQSQEGACFSLGIGVQLNPIRYFGLTLHTRYTSAPVLENALGETHDLGTLATLFGLRLRTWGWP